MGMPTWLAHTATSTGGCCWRAALRPTAPCAEGLLAEAAALAEQIGMPALLARTTSLASPGAMAAVALPDGLSPREIQILRLVAQGLSNREIGSELTIAEHTAANHMRSILRKSRSANRTEAASYAHRRGLV